MLKYIFIGQIAKRRTSPVFAVTMQNTTKNSTWSGTVFGRASWKQTEDLLYYIIFEFIAMYALVSDVHICLR